MKSTDKYSVLYKINIKLITLDSCINIPTSDIVSISLINNYDTMTYPITRIRLYSDIDILTRITESCNNLNIRCTLDGGVYRMNDDDKSPVLINPTNSIYISSSVYIENKNTPTSSMDQYIDGIKKDNTLNENVKVPIELYCYNDELIHLMKQKSQSIYKQMSLSSIIDDILRRNSVMNYKIDPLDNQNKYDQVLIPNLNILQALMFLDNNYGLYRKGAQLYDDNVVGLRLCSTDINNNTTPIPIYIESYKNTNNMGGMKKLHNGFNMNTMASNVSIISATDIEKIMNSQEIAAINLNTLRIDTNRLQKLYAVGGRLNEKITKSLILSTQISTPDTLHKTHNDYITDAIIARVNEKITRVDLSGTGFDISKLNIDSRYNLIFESPIRGMNMNEYYRSTYTCHVLSNLDSDLFVAQTTMNLCSN